MTMRLRLLFISCGDDRVSIPTHRDSDRIINSTFCFDPVAVARGTDTLNPAIDSALPKSDVQLIARGNGGRLAHDRAARILRDRVTAFKSSQRRHRIKLGRSHAELAARAFNP